MSLSSSSSSSLPLSVALKTGTVTVHEQAEHVHFIVNLFHGEIHHDMFKKFLGNLYHVYQCLESLLDEVAAVDVNLASCHFPHELNRTSALLEDLDFWMGEGVIPPPSPATVEYMQRMKEIAAGENPLLLLAHAYTRYLGDLSGGKILGRVAKRALHVDDPEDGLNFFLFPHVPSAKLFKDTYKAAMDALPLNADQIQALVAESKVAFVLNIRLFEEMDVYAKVPGATVRPLALALQYADPHYHGPDTKVVDEEEPHGAAAECPFLVKDHVVEATKAVVRCPWPFIAFHDPLQFARDWQTWVMLFASALGWVVMMWSQPMEGAAHPTT
eukprot:scaffold8073_cov127-Amphora_coffeaeformis.AAC.3